MYQHIPKNEAISCIHSGEIVDLKILQSNWMGAFWPISQEQDFSTQQQNIYFHYRKNSVKINDQVFSNSKNPIVGLFLTPFPQSLEQNKIYFKKPWLCHAQLHNGLYHLDKIQGNLMIQSQENTQTDSWMEGRMDPVS